MTDDHCPLFRWEETRARDVNLLAQEHTAREQLIVSNKQPKPVFPFWSLITALGLGLSNAKDMGMG